MCIAEEVFLTTQEEEEVPIRIEIVIQIDLEQLAEILQRQRQDQELRQSLEVSITHLLNLDLEIILTQSLDQKELRLLLDLEVILNQR